MEFSYLKAINLRPKKEKWLSTFLISLGVAALFFVPFIILGEGYFIFYGDFNVQQIPFYQQCHEAIKNGNIFWSTTTDLGANFIGSYSFYLLGSPFFWLTIPFPNSFVPYLMGPLLILKFGCAALTSYFYIRRFTRTPEAARLGGILYAFSGFSVYNIFFNHFHEAIIFFPLLLLSLELLITENRRFAFAFMVCICAISNYFFFFGMVVFTVIYFLVRLLSKSIKIKFSRFLVIVFEAVIGLLLSAFILLPAILAITDNYRLTNTLMGWNAIMYGKEQIYANILQCFFFPPDIPARPVFFPGANVKWSSLGGWLPLFSMVGVFTLFAKKKGSWQKRLLGICIFMALVPILNSAFYAFNSAYYARWFYMPILIMSLSTVTLLEDSKIDWSFGYKWVLSITLAVTFVIGLFPQKDKDENIIFGLYSQSDDRMYFYRFWITSAIAIASLVILGFLLKTLKTNRKAFFKSALVFTCIIALVYSTFFIASGRSHSYDAKEIMIDTLIEGEVDLEDDSEFRVDVYDGVDNTSMYLGFDGINAFHSIVPASVFEFYDFIGVERVVGSRPETDCYAIRPLLSVKYLLNRKTGDSFVDTDTKETLMPDYKYLKTENGYYVYENENYIPYGFSYDYYMSYDFCEDYTNENRANMMLKAILLTDDQIKKYGSLMTNIEEAEEYHLAEEPKTSLSVSYDAFRYDCEKLKETSAKSFIYDNRGFTATVSREKDSLVFFSVPYDKGWSATVNGSPAEIEKVNSGFMAVKVKAGESRIRFVYTTPGLSEGLATTAITALVFLIYIFVFLLWNIKHKPSYDYPEGEILMAEWTEEERNEAIIENTPKKPSILDDIDDISIPSINQGFENGFKIETEKKEDN